VLAAVAGCAGISAGSDYAPSVDFTAPATFSWEARDALPTGDPRLDNNPFFDSRVKAAVEDQLSAAGYRRVDSDARLRVHYHFHVSQRLDIYAIDRPAGYTFPGGRDSTTHVYDEGTLVVDLIDARTRAMVWRGWARSNLEGVINDRARMHARIDELILRMFEKFPPGG
jgi:hypothetical protein